MKRGFLIVSAVGLSMVGLSYGIVPGILLPKLFGFPVDTVNLIHMFRGVMFLYWGMAGFWLYAAFQPPHMHAAVVSVVFFMGGLALGRFVSIVVDGTPHWLLLLYLSAELLLAVGGLWVLKNEARGRVHVAA